MVQVSVCVCVFSQAVKALQIWKRRHLSFLKKKRSRSRVPASHSPPKKRTCWQPVSFFGSFLDFLLQRTKWQPLCSVFTYFLPPNSLAAGANDLRDDWFQVVPCKQISWGCWEMKAPGVVLLTRPIQQRQIIHTDLPETKPRLTPPVRSR